MGNEVGIENGDEIRRMRIGGEHAQRVVDIAGLGAEIVGAAQIAHPLALTEVAQPVAPSVVEDEHVAVRMMARLRPDDRSLEHVALLVKGCDQDRHFRRIRLPPGQIAIGLLRTRAGPAEDGEGAERGQAGRRLGKKEGPAEQAVPGQADRGKRLGCPPPEVAQREQGGDGKQAGPVPAVLRVQHVVQQQGRTDEEQRQHRHGLDLAAEEEAFHRQFQSRRSQSSGRFSKNTRPVRPMRQRNSSSSRSAGTSRVTSKRPRWRSLGAIARLW